MRPTVLLACLLRPGLRVTQGKRCPDSDRSVVIGVQPDATQILTDCPVSGREVPLICVAKQFGYGYESCARRGEPPPGAGVGANTYA